MMMDSRRIRSNTRSRFRSGPMWSFAGDEDKLEKERQRLQKERDHEGLGGKIVLTQSARGDEKFIVAVVHSTQELEAMATMYVKLVQDLKKALLQKWARTRPVVLPSERETSSFVDHRPHDIRSIQKRLAKLLHVNHSKTLCHTQREIGGSSPGSMLLTNQDLQQGTWFLLLSYLSGLALPSILESVRSFLFFRSEDGRVLELLVRHLSSDDNESTLEQRQQQILREDGGGLFDLVDLLEDAPMGTQQNSSSLGSHVETSEQRPSKRRRTTFGNVASGNESTMQSSVSNPGPLPVSLMMLWVHLVDRELAVELSETVVSQAALEKRLHDIRSRDRSQFVFEDSLRLYGLERAMLYPEQSPLKIKRAVEALLSHNESALVSLSKASGLPYLVAYSRLAEMLLLHHYLDGAADSARELLRRKGTLYNVKEFCIPASLSGDERGSRKRPHDNIQSPLISGSLAKSLLDPAYPLYVNLEVSLYFHQLEGCLLMGSDMEASAKFTKQQWIIFYLRIFNSFMCTNKLFDLDFTNMHKNPLYMFVTSSSCATVLLFCDFYNDLTQHLATKTHVLPEDEQIFLRESCEEAICYLLRTKFPDVDACGRYQSLTGKSVSRYRHILKQLSATFTTPGPSIKRPGTCSLVPHHNPGENRFVVDFCPLLRRAGYFDSGSGPRFAPMPSLLAPAPLEFFSPAQITSTPVDGNKHALQCRELIDQVKQQDETYAVVRNPPVEQNSFAANSDVAGAGMDEQQVDVVVIDLKDDDATGILGDKDYDDLIRRSDNEIDGDENYDQQDEDEAHYNAEYEEQDGQPSYEEQALEAGDGYPEGDNRFFTDPETGVELDNEEIDASYADEDERTEQDDKYSQDLEEQEENIPGEEDDSELKTEQEPERIGQELRSHGSTENHTPDNGRPPTGFYHASPDGVVQQSRPKDEYDSVCFEVQEMDTDGSEGIDENVRKAQNIDRGMREGNLDYVEETLGEDGDNRDEKVASTLDRLADEQVASDGPFGAGDKDDDEAEMDDDSPEFFSQSIPHEAAIVRGIGLEQSSDQIDEQASDKAGRNENVPEADIVYHGMQDSNIKVSLVNGGMNPVEKQASTLEKLVDEQVASTSGPFGADEKDDEETEMEDASRADFPRSLSHGAALDSGMASVHSSDQMNEQVNAVQANNSSGGTGATVSVYTAGRDGFEKPRQYQDRIVNHEVDEGYDATEEEDDHYNESKSAGLSYDSASQEETASFAASQRADSTRRVIDSLSNSVAPPNLEALSRGNTRSTAGAPFDVGYDATAEESQDQTEAEEDRPQEGPRALAHCLEDSVVSNEHRHGHEKTNPASDGYDSEESQGPTEDEDRLMRTAETETERSSVMEDPVGVNKDKVIALGDGYDATAEDESQGHTEEEDDRPTGRLTVDGEGRALDVQQVVQDQQTKGERHVEFAPLRKSESSTLDAGYLPDDAQDHTEDEVPRNRVDGYQGGDSSICHSEDEGAPTDIEDDEAKRNTEPKQSKRILEVHQGVVQQDTQSISGMSAADERTTCRQDGESSEPEEGNEKRLLQTGQLPFQQAKLQDYAAAAQQDYLHVSKLKSVKERSLRKEDDAERLELAFRSPKLADDGRIAIENDDVQLKPSPNSPIVVELEDPVSGLETTNKERQDKDMIAEQETMEEATVDIKLLPGDVRDTLVKPTDEKEVIRDTEESSELELKSSSLNTRDVATTQEGFASEDKQFINVADVRNDCTNTSVGNKEDSENVDVPMETEEMPTYPAEGLKNDQETIQVVNVDARISLVPLELQAETTYKSDEPNDDQEAALVVQEVEKTANVGEVKNDQNASAVMKEDLETSLVAVDTEGRPSTRINDLTNDQEANQVDEKNAKASRVSVERQEEHMTRSNEPKSDQEVSVVDQEDDEATSILMGHEEQRLARDQNESAIDREGMEKAPVSMETEDDLTNPTNDQERDEVDKDFINTASFPVELGEENINNSIEPNTYQLAGMVDQEDEGDKTASVLTEQQEELSITADELTKDQDASDMETAPVLMETEEEITNLSNHVTRNPEADQGNQGEVETASPVAVREESISRSNEPNNALAEEEDETALVTTQQQEQLNDVTDELKKDRGASAVHQEDTETGGLAYPTNNPSYDQEASRVDQDDVKTASLPLELQQETVNKSDKPNHDQEAGLVDKKDYESASVPVQQPEHLADDPNKYQEADLEDQEDQITSLDKEDANAAPVSLETKNETSNTSDNMDNDKETLQANLEDAKSAPVPSEAKEETSNISDRLDDNRRVSKVPDEQQEGLTDRTDVPNNNLDASVVNGESFDNAASAVEAEEITNPIDDPNTDQEKKLVDRDDAKTSPMPVEAIEEPANHADDRNNAHEASIFDRDDGDGSLQGLASSVSEVESNVDATFASQKFPGNMEAPLHELVGQRVGSDSASLFIESDDKNVHYSGEGDRKSMEGKDDMAGGSFRDFGFISAQSKDVPTLDPPSGDLDAIRDSGTIARVTSLIPIPEETGLFESGFDPKIELAHASRTTRSRARQSKDTEDRESDQDSKEHSQNEEQIVPRAEDVDDRRTTGSRKRSSWGGSDSEQMKEEGHEATDSSAVKRRRTDPAKGNQVASKTADKADKEEPVSETTTRSTIGRRKRAESIARENDALVANATEALQKKTRSAVRKADKGEPQLRHDKTAEAYGLPGPSSSRSRTARGTRSSDVTSSIAPNTDDEKPHAQVRPARATKNSKMKTATIRDPDDDGSLSTNSRSRATRSISSLGSARLTRNSKINNAVILDKDDDVSFVSANSNSRTTRSARNLAGLHHGEKSELPSKAISPRTTRSTKSADGAAASLHSEKGLIVNIGGKETGSRKRKTEGDENDASAVSTTMKKSKTVSARSRRMEEGESIDTPKTKPTRTLRSGDGNKAAPGQEKGTPASNTSSNQTRSSTRRSARYKK